MRKVCLCLYSANRPVPLTASPSPSPSPAQFFLDLTLQNPKPETQVWGTTPVSRLRLFMMLRGRDNFNKKYLIKFRTNDKLKLITLKCEIEVIKRKNVCVCVYLVLQSVSVVRFTRLCLTATKPNLPLQKHRTMARYAANWSCFAHHSFTMSFKSYVAFPLNTQSFALQRKVNKRFRISLIILPSSVPGAKERLYVEKENPGVLRAIQSPNSILE